MEWFCSGIRGSPADDGLVIGRDVPATHPHPGDEADLRPRPHARGCVSVAGSSCGHTDDPAGRQITNIKRALIAEMGASGGMVLGMSPEVVRPSFQLTVKEVFSLTGRGPAVMGKIDLGSIRVGDLVEIWDGQRLVASAEVAHVDAAVRTTDPDARVGLVFRSEDLDRHRLRPGQVVRRL